MNFHLNQLGAIIRGWPDGQLFEGTKLAVEEIRDFASKVIENVQQVIVGKREAIELLMVALLADGHVLIEDVPGVGKTMLARALAISIGGQFKRLQCTPDLMPNDIMGVSIFNQRSQEFEFRPGPVFVNFLLADEINRATPRTQAALLEAMQESQVSIDGVSHALPRPFLVLATQNPIEYEGTFPLPEAQLDRFLLRIMIGYPSESDEQQVLRNLRGEHPIHSLGQVADAQQLIDFQKKIWDVHVDESIGEYIVRLATATRDHADLARGASPRGSLGLYKACQAFAALDGRAFVIPDDVKYLAPKTWLHRLVLAPEAQLRGRRASGVLQGIVETTELEIGALD